MDVDTAIKYSVWISGAMSVLAFALTLRPRETLVGIIVYFIGLVTILGPIGVLCYDMISGIVHLAHGDSGDPHYGVQFVGLTLAGAILAFPVVITCLLSPRISAGVAMFWSTLLHVIVLVPTLLVVSSLLRTPYYLFLIYVPLWYRIRRRSAATR